jgi:hypothetical protein
MGSVRHSRLLGQQRVSSHEQLCHVRARDVGWRQSDRVLEEATGTGPVVAKAAHELDRHRVLAAKQVWCFPK